MSQDSGRVGKFSGPAAGTMRRWAVGFGLALAVLFSHRAPAQAAPRIAEPKPAPAIVGYWLGEKVVPRPGETPSKASTYYNAADRSALTADVWRILAARRIPLYLHLRYGRDFGPLHPGAQSDAVALVRKANSLGVPVIGWIVVPPEQGYWAYQGNAQVTFEAVKAWTAWKTTRHLRFEAVALDQEFSSQNLRAYVAALTGQDPEKLSSWMRGNVDPPAQCAALRTYRDLISWAHRAGVRVDAAEAPMVVDDLADGKLALQNALQIAGSSPGYDRLYLMAYRSAVGEMARDPGPAYASSYYTAMQKYFGASGQVSLGIPGEGAYAALAPLVNDVRMLVGLGAKQIPIYSLEAMVGKFGPEGLEALAQAAERPMSGAELAAFTKPTPGSEGAHAMSRSHDAMASALTVAVTTQQGRPQAPNSWPDGCGNLSVDPLVKTPR